MSNALGENVPAVETDKALQATLNALFSFEQRKRVKRRNVIGFWGCIGS